MKPKYTFLFIVIILLPALAVGSWLVVNSSSTNSFLSPNSQPQPTPEPTPLPLLDYTFKHLRNSASQASTIHIEEVMEESEQFNSYLISYTTRGKRVTGQLNVPQTATPSGGFPVIVMLRGWVDPSWYQTGIGTEHGAGVLAQNNFVTISPDFLGYGGSDNPDPNVFAARVHKPKTVLDLLSSLQSLSFINPDRIGIWGHSNGGQIALSVLEITGKSYPTTLWAPVSKGFPYNILYYTDEYDDGGKALRQELARFEQDYDVFDFSIDRYWDWIQAPILLHQGTADDAVPVEWSAELAQTLKDLDVDLTFHTYPGADHNMVGSWDTVISRDIEFFTQHLPASNSAITRFSDITPE